MTAYIAKLSSTAPYSQSRFHDTDKLDKESPDAYEKRTWRNRLHATEDGHVFIPPMSFKNCLCEAAKYLSIQIPGKGKATYTKHFESGVLVTDPLVIDVKVDDVQGLWLFLPSDGRPGGGRRVKKCMPFIPKWEGDVTFHIFDETVTRDVFERVLVEAGKFIGIGFFRPRNRGYYGRFTVNSITVSE